ncbi:MAG: decarboxylase [Chloroflexi bacterium]|nr:decarboxylase [Chloroflexota bacterium]
MGERSVEARYSPYGWRARIGLILGAQNITTEPEMHFMAPDGVSIHVARIPIRDAAAAESFQHLQHEIEAAAWALSSAEVDVVAYIASFGSLIQGSGELTRRVSELTGVPAITTADALLEALEALEVQRIAVATPYLDVVNNLERTFFKSHGFQVVSVKSLELGRNEGEQRTIGRLPPEVAYRLAKEADSDEAQALLISSATLAASDVLEFLEDDLDKPVVACNPATLWAALRRVRIAEQIEGFGQLLREY